MTTSQVIKEVAEVLWDEAQSDTVGLWVALWEVKKRLPAVSTEEARVVVLSAISAVLKQGGVVPGEFVDRDDDHLAFVPWDLTTDEALARIDEEWSKLGREPHLGEVAWFVAPSLMPITALKHPMGRDWKPSGSKERGD